MVGGMARALVFQTTINTLHLDENTVPAAQLVLAAPAGATHEASALAPGEPTETRHAIPEVVDHVFQHQLHHHRQTASDDIKRSIYSGLQKNARAIAVHFHITFIVSVYTCTYEELK